MANLASALIIVVTTCASLLYVLKRPRLDVRQKLTVLILAMLAGVPVGFVLFVLLSLVNIMRFWDTGIWDRERRGVSVLRGAHGRPAELDACPHRQHDQRRRSPEIGDGRAGHVHDRRGGNACGHGPGTDRRENVPDRRAGCAGRRPTIADGDNRRGGVIPPHRRGNRGWFLLVERRLLAMLVELFVLLIVTVVATIVHRYQ